MQLNIHALKAIRTVSGDSQESLAARAGISEVALNRLEQGKTRARISTMKKLAAALSVPVGAITLPDTEREES